MKADKLKEASKKVSNSVEEIRKRADFVIRSAHPFPGDKNLVGVDKNCLRHLNSALKKYNMAREEFGAVVAEHMKT